MGAVECAFFSQSAPGVIVAFSISDRAQQLQPSATLVVAEQAAALRAQGIDIIAMGAGEPDFDTPDHIKHAAILAIENNQTHYTAVDGTPELKSAIIEKLQRDNELRYSADEIIVSCGAKHCIFNLMQAVLNPGDEVMIQAPYWVSYPDMAKLCGASPVIIDCVEARGYKLSAAQLAAAVTDNTRLLVLNSPCNPTGMAFTAAELEELATALRKHPDVYIMSDEIYESIYWGDEPLRNLLQAAPDLRDRFFLINGVSKGYAMTGWRIGYAAGPSDVTKQMRKIQGQSTSNPCSIAQAAAAAALGGDQSCIDPMRDAFRSRQSCVEQAIAAVPGVDLQPGQGTFYAFLDCRVAIEAQEEIGDDVQLCEFLLNQAHVALVPGTAFGAPGFIRMSYATSQDKIKQAVGRIAKALS